MQGVSGAGRGGGDAMHYVSMDENAFAYKTEGHRHRPEIEQELAALGSPAPVTFVPHLLPLDQGELTSCFAQLTEPISKEEVQALYRERYADEPFVHVVDGPPDLRDVRDTNECHVYVTVEERGRRARLLGDRQPLEGGLRPGGPEPQPDARARRDGGAAMSEPASSDRAGSSRRPGSRSSTPRSSRRASRRRRRTAASRRAARPTSARGRRDDPSVSTRRCC